EPLSPVSEATFCASSCLVIECSRFGYEIG
ncbi:MAG: hypothetical protein QOJ85_580, partial [Solirubrobacteraceae bacterium]|nr:hypothetical protein [Solirubrobacteraceae bacterium]